MATDFMPVAGTTATQLAEAALLASLVDETPEGRSIVALATGEYGCKASTATMDAVIPFAAETRLSGVDVDGRRVRKGAVDSILKFAGIDAAQAPQEFRQAVDRIAPVSYTHLTLPTNREV